jgi:7,8-dihydroneopterin aldolase/epimerase/oxygenase
MPHEQEAMILIQEAMILMDLILIRGLRIDTIVGHYLYEREAAQPLDFDLELAIPNPSVYQSDRLHDTINYAAVAEYIRRECNTHHFRLLERMADHLARGILAEFDTSYAKLTVVKLGILKGIRQVGVTVERSQN